MSEHIGPGNDSGPFQSGEADRRALVEKLEREHRDALYAEIEDAQTPKTKAKTKAKNT